MQYLSRRPVWFGLFCIAMTCLTGCDGYPSEDLPLVDPFHLSPAARLQRLNQLGQSPNAVDSWRYQVEADCALAVSVRSKGADWAQKQVGLQQKSVKLAYRADNAIYDVRADAHHGPQPGIALFRGKDRGTALEVTLLVKLLARDCQTEPDSPATGSA